MALTIEGLDLSVPFLAKFFLLGSASGGVLGRRVGQNLHLQLRKHVIKSLNMMGNDPQRTGYVVSNHLLTPGLF